MERYGIEFVEEHMQKILDGMSFDDLDCEHKRWSKENYDMYE